jgi:hypothetical protein
MKIKTRGKVSQTFSLDICNKIHVKKRCRHSICSVFIHKNKFNISKHPITYYGGHDTSPHNTGSGRPPSPGQPG